MKKFLLLFLSLFLIINCDLTVYAEEEFLSEEIEETVEEVNEEVVIEDEESIQEETPVVEIEEVQELLEEATYEEEIIILEEVVEELEVISEEAKEASVYNTLTTEEKKVNKYANIKSTEASINGFVVRLYRNVLDREPDDGGFEYWTNGINNKSITGGTAVKGFFLSKEMDNKNLSNTDFIKLLYLTVLNREADKGGLNYWEKCLEVKMTRESVINGFINSKEFTNLCNKYGVDRGSNQYTNNYRDQNYNVTSFVERMYTKALGRGSDIPGLENWCKKLLDKSITGAELVTGFFFSKEFENKNLNHTDFVKTAYRAILDREADSSGLKHWVNKLNNGTSRKEVLAGFIESKEFTNLCNTYGIERGTLNKFGWKVENGKSYYYKSNGVKAVMEVITIDGKQCGFNADGVYIGDKSNEYLTVYQKAINLVKEITNDSMTKEQKLRACFDIFRQFTEKNPWIPHDRSEGWVFRYANNCFDTRSGNCISYGVSFGFMAKALGYDNIYLCNSGGHGWAEIDGKVYDPEWTIHRPGNYFARSLNETDGPNYAGAINRNSTYGYYRL